jgi:predicted Zn-dependent peptidase
MSLCYHCSAQLHRFKGVLVVRAGVDTEKVPQARAAILEQLRQMQAGEFTEEDLATSKRALCDGFRTVYDLPESLAGWYTTALLTGEDQSPEELSECIRAVTHAQVVAAAQGVTLDTAYLLAAKEGCA